MISYNKTWLANLRLQEQLKKDLDQGLVTDNEFAAIAEKYPVGFYSPRLPVRAGLFVLTCIIVIFADGLLSIMATSIVESAGWFLFLALLSYISLELMVGVKFQYRSGVDDALLIISGTLFTGAVYLFIYRDTANSENLVIAEIVFTISLWLSIRFADMPASGVCAVSFFSIVLYGWVRIGSTGLTTAPFVMMLVAAFIFWRVTSYKNKKVFVNYRNSLFIAQIVSLATLYAAGNYYVVQTLGNELKGIQNPGSTAIPFGAFFWVWTMLTPFIYTGIGIYKKNAMLLRVGLPLIAAAAITFRHYYHILPVDVDLTLIGAIILAIVYGTTQYLKTPKHGFTVVDLNEGNKADQINIESLAVGESFSHTPTATTGSGVKFGGGDFGGGGASGGF